ncbi:5-methyltetrahydrofolate--homocysteine methyltransferase [Marinimicrobium alkaliphilum]|uniref:5-methyltetrahydrofolate--homocysteine methyltransferase n=1 Tax=Marinimicrobium alkaliphilum TaxID=2202654 RepID=UPI000DB9509B|nr:5-methyltetrahydrofolate--homocysteine methyltransferase [Marinimicrobium alkaliphilum]
MNKHAISYLTYPALALSAVLLTACGGSSTNIIERDPIADDDHDDHHHDHGDLGGRLLISEHDDDHVYVYDVAHEEVIAEMHLDGVPTALYATPGQRYGVVVRGGDNGQVNFVDSGLYWEDHGDHGHMHEGDPALLELELFGDRPAHVTNGGHRTAIFFDGNAGAPAQVKVVNDHDMSATPALLEYSANQHGAAQVRSSYLLSSILDHEEESTLPNLVGVYHRHDGIYELEETLDVGCPGLHGSAQNAHHIAFGCTDGVLLIEEHRHDNSRDYHAHKISSEIRIGTLFGHDHLEDFVGVGGGVLYRVATEGEGSIEPINWTGEADLPVVGSVDSIVWGDLSAVGYAFAEHGELFVILDNHGGLTVLDTHDWDVVGERLQVTHSHSAPDGLRFEMTVSGDGHFVFVTDPAEQEIRVVDIEDREVYDTFSLDFTPNKLVWLGVVTEEDDHDDHGHDEHGHNDDHDHEDEHDHGDEHDHDH